MLDARKKVGEYGGKNGGMVDVTIISASASERTKMRTGREQASCASGSRFINEVQMVQRARKSGAIQGLDSGE